MVDGDKSLVVADRDFIRIAERNMNGIVPLYYNMRKAEPMELNNKNIYSGLNAAFTHGNIGIYSNNISKIWNSDIFGNGTNEEKQEAINIVKLLCMENNFCIDAAKTLYMPERVGAFSKRISEFTNNKLPAFFEFAKDKEKSQVEKRNESFVNKLFDKIPNKPINTRGLKLGKIDYRKMMNNETIVCSKEVSDLYGTLNKEYRYKVNMKDEYIDNLHYVACSIREEFRKLGYSNETIADMLVKYLYGGEKRAKQLFWFCYGQYVVNNLENNIVVNKTKFIQCVDCGEWIEIDEMDYMTNRCKVCYDRHRKEYFKLKKREQRKNVHRA